MLRHFGRGQLVVVSMFLGRRRVGCGGLLTVWC